MCVRCKATKADHNSPCYCVAVFVHRNHVEPARCCLVCSVCFREYWLLIPFVAEPRNMDSLPSHYWRIHDTEDDTSLFATTYAAVSVDDVLQCR